MKEFSWASKKQDRTENDGALALSRFIQRGVKSVIDWSVLPETALPRRGFQALPEQRQSALRRLAKRGVLDHVGTHPSHHPLEARCIKPIDKKVREEREDIAYKEQYKRNATKSSFPRTDELKEPFRNGKRKQEGRAIATMQKKMKNATAWTLGLVLAFGMAACRVNVHKNASGDDKNVQVDTPFGGVHVNTNQTTASDLGLPVYPGAVPVKADDKHKSADVHVGFGQWQLRVKEVSYQTPDSSDKVIAFYKKAMARYGDVITCQNNSPVGTPTTTSEGLTCTDDKNSANIKIDSSDYGSGHSLELKAGSKRHQHILGFEGRSGNDTRFSLVAVDLPTTIESKSGKSD
jgi:hypothetical protein